MALQYLNGITGQKLFYFDDHLWHITRVRPNYRKCTESGCGSHLTTNNDKLKDDRKNCQKYSHDPFSLEESKIMRHFSVIKKRIEAEVHTFPSEIFEDEIIKLSVDQRILSKCRQKISRKFPKISNNWTFLNTPNSQELFIKKNFFSMIKRLPITVFWSLLPKKAYNFQKNLTVGSLMEPFTMHLSL